MTIVYPLALLLFAGATDKLTSSDKLTSRRRSSRLAVAAATSSLTLLARSQQRWADWP
jgi:hypothetical protein